jgi:hypothetical protein
MEGTTSSPAQIPAHVQPYHPNGHLKPLAHYQAHRGDEGAQSEHRTCNPCCGWCDDWEGCRFSPEGPGPKAFRSNIHDARFPKCFRALNNIVKYDGKTNPNVWLEDYHLACRVGTVDDNLFIIQFLPIYLADTVRAWLNQ